MLNKLPFFENLSLAELARLKEISFLKRYNSGEILFFQGEKSRYLLFLKKGEIKIYTTLPRGREILLHNLKAPNFVAELANFKDMPYPASAVCVSECEILKIDYETFNNEFLKKQEICFEFLKSMSAKLCIVESFIHQNLTYTAEQKVANLLLENYEKFKNSKNTDLANELNISAETLSRTLAKFKKTKILSSDNEILSIEKLEKILGV